MRGPARGPPAPPRPEPWREPTSPRESVSAWLTRAAEEQLDEQARLEIGLIAARETVAEYEAQHGPIPPEITAEVDAFLAGPGSVPILPPPLRETG